MALDGIAIASIIHELNQRTENARISKIAQPEKDELILTIKGPGGQFRLMISASASLPMACIVEENKPSPLTAPNFCMLLRKHIANGKIISITQPDMERVIDMEIEHFDELGDLKRKHLIIELMGKHSNIIFTDDKNMILDSIKHVGANVSSVREVLPGRDYFIPKTLDKANPLDTANDEFASLVYSKPMTLAKGIYTSYTGISPVIAEEICYRAGIESDSHMEELDENSRLHLYNIFTHVMDDVREGKFAPCIIYDEEDKPVEFSALPLSMYKDMRTEEYESMSQVLVSYYAHKAKVGRIRQKSVDLRKITSTLLDRERKKYELQIKQLKDTEDRDKYRIYGELINAFGYNLEPGAKVLVAQNYYDNNAEIKIPMDSTMTPQENSVKYFNKYNKMKRTFDALTEQLEETKSVVAHLESISAALDMAMAEDDLAEIRDELADYGFIKKKGPVKGKKQHKSKPYHYETSEGFQVYVGKNNYQNDELSFKFATGNDWWFHAKEMPGSHVILKNENGNVTDRAMEEAAMLAAYYSSGREGKKVEIDYTQKKNLKKPNGAKPGFVVYYTNYSMTVAPDIKSLKEV